MQKIYTFTLTFCYFFSSPSFLCNFKLNMPICVVHCIVINKYSSTEGIYYVLSPPISLSLVVWWIYLLLLLLCSIHRNVLQPNSIHAMVCCFCSTFIIYSKKNIHMRVYQLSNFTEIARMYVNKMQSQLGLWPVFYVFYNIILLLLDFLYVSACI